MNPPPSLSPRTEGMICDYCDRMVAKGRKPGTVRTYGNMIRICLKALDCREPEDVTEDDIQHLRMTLDVKESSQKSYFHVLGRFIEHVTGRDPVKEADLLWNRDEAKRKFISVEEFRTLQECADRRDSLVLMLGGMMGLRRAEIAGIRLDDIDGRMLTVRGKGHGMRGKVAYLTLPLPVIEAMEEWMEVRRSIIREQGDRTEGHLIVTYAGLPAKPSTISYMLTDLAERAGVDFSAHSLRRLYATTLYRAGTDLDTLRRMMRHSNLQTTVDCYIAADPDKINQAMDALSSILG